MSPERLHAVVSLYAEILGDLGVLARRHDDLLKPESDRGAPHLYLPADPIKVAQHALWMCDQCREEFLPKGDNDKAERWLNWLHGALTLMGLRTIAQTRDHNREPKPEEPTPEEPTHEPTTGGRPC